MCTLTSLSLLCFFVSAPTCSHRLKVSALLQLSAPEELLERTSLRVVVVVDTRGEQEDH